MAFEFTKNYLNHLEVIKYADTTIHSTKHAIKQFEEYCLSLGISSEKAVTEKAVSGYMTILKERVKTPTYACYLEKIRKYFLYLEQEGLLFVSPLREVELPKVPRPLTRILTEQEIFDFLKRIDTSKRKGIRLRAIFELLYSSALRPGELVNIKFGDIDFQKKTLFISQSKNLKDRIVPVGDSALFWVTRYLEEVRPYFHRDSTSPFIFLQFSKRGKRMTAVSLQHYLAYAVNQHGITGFYPSMLRPSAASHMLARGMDIRLIQQLLGHNDITTTQLYLRVSLHELRKHVSPNYPADQRRKDNEV